jgi:peptidyl-prolyl cis-trans isomerase C
MQNKFANFLIVVFIGIVIFINCSKERETALPAEKKREFANVLYNQQLFAQAAQEYEDYLHTYLLSPGERANISYQIGNIYLDRLHDYENALAYYLRVKYLYPESNLQKEVGKKIVECLERLQRSTDAQQLIEQTTVLDESQKPKSHPGEVVARIGTREITSGDLRYEINNLPPYLQSQLSDPKQKTEFLKQYIVQELLYDSAKRKGMDRNKEVLEGVFQAKKGLMAQKLLQEEIEMEINLDKYTNDDVELYYKAKKEKYAEKDKDGKVKRIPDFPEVAQQAAQDFIQEKQQEAYNRLVERLMKAEQVEIYEGKID